MGWVRGQAKAWKSLTRPNLRRTLHNCRTVLPFPGRSPAHLCAARPPFPLGCLVILLGLPTEVCMLSAIPRVVPTAAVVGLFLTWVPYDVASAAKPRDFGTGSAGRPLHTAAPASVQTSISN